MGADLKLLYDVMVSYYGCGFKVRTRRRFFSDKKAMFSYIGRKLGATYQAIANELGLNHTSVIHGESLMEDLIAADPAFNKQLNEIMDEYEFRQWAGILVGSESE